MDEPRGRWEYAYWQRFDPHARAYAVLESEESRRIEQSLHRLPSPELARPQEDGLCLSCHVHQDFSGADHGPGFSVSDGVGCESCHGASQLWNSVHFQASWRTLSVEQKAAYGFVPLDSLVDRAHSCTPCHIGSSEAEPILGLVDVNHDLIAAGHPRLTFEFASYHAQYPKHWGDREERLADPSYEARAWIVGQLTTTEAALRLLKARAERSEQVIMEQMPRPLESPSDPSPHSGPWPEFAEYDCFACHHDLRGGGSTGLGIASAIPGQFPWGGWYTPMSEVIASEMPPSSRDWSQLLGSIKAEMVRPMPDTDRVVERVDEALDELDAWLIVLRSRPLDAGAVDRLMSASVDRFRSSSEPTWDRGAQLYLAVAALYAARCDLNPSRRDPAMADALGMLLERLSFPGDSNSPREYRIKELDSPLSAIRSRADTDE